jgi:hypothetical protein
MGYDPVCLSNSLNHRYFSEKAGVRRSNFLDYSGSQLHEVHLEAQCEVPGAFIAMNYEL